MSRAVGQPLALLLLAASSQGHGVTPVEKVVELLTNLEKKVEGEGAQEATAYDKYACFCKEESDNKLYNIETSREKITKMSAKIDKLTGEITELDGEIGTLSTEITNLGTEMEGHQTTRAEQYETFLAAQADMASAISAVERAIKAMKESKTALGGKAEREGLLQVRKVASTALTVAARTEMTLSDQQVSQLNELLGNNQPGEAYTSEYHSNDIIATLEGLRQTFKKRKLELEDTDFNAKTIFELRQQALANEQKFKQKEKAEKEAVREAKTEEKEATEADKAQEIKDKNADQNFLDVLKADCETKAGLWDQRSRTRADEMQAISEALEALKTGVAPNWKANKKLVGMQQKAAVKGHWVYVAEEAPASVRPASFLQTLRGASNLRGAASTQAQIAHKVRELLESSAKDLRSPVLSMAALKVTAAEDHFVKVRQIIQDLIAKLEADATDEETQKSFCDTEMGKAVTRRDTAQSVTEEKKAAISGKTAAKAQLMREIAELSAQIAANKKALLEATELRAKESEENAKTIEDAGAGRQAVEQAITVLNTFYQAHGFLQFVPTNSDREGLTVADRTPEVFDAEYKGSQEASKGIIGMLEVILSDFDRTDTTVASEESQAVSDFTTFKNANEADTTTKDGSKETKNGQYNVLAGEIMGLTQDLNDAEQDHKDANKELDVLHNQCVAGEETYEERVAARMKEVEALKQALVILDDWQK